MIEGKLITLCFWDGKFFLLETIDFDCYLGPFYKIRESALKYWMFGFKGNFLAMGDYSV